MALIKCPECGKEISNKAMMCPNCGYPIAANTVKEDERPKKASGKSVEINPLELWNYNYSACKLLEYKQKPDSGYKFYDYADLFKAIGLPGEFLLSRHLGEIKEREFMKLSPLTRSIGIQVEASNVEAFESLIVQQKKLFKETHDHENKNFVLRVERDDEFLINIFDLVYIEDTVFYKKVRVNEAYKIKKELIDSSIKTARAKQGLNQFAKMAMMGPGSPPTSVGTSTMIGGIIGGTTGALYGAARGAEEQRKHREFVDSYNSYQQKYTNAIEACEDEISRLEMEKACLTLPQGEASKCISCYGIRTLIGIMPIYFHDVKKDPDVYYYDEDGIWCEFTNETISEDFTFNRKKLELSELKSTIKKNKSDKQYRTMQLAAFLDGKPEAKDFPYIPKALNGLKEDADYETYLNKVKECKEDVEEKVISTLSKTKKGKYAFTKAEIMDLCGLGTALSNQKLSTVLSKLEREYRVEKKDDRYAYVTDEYKEYKKEKYKEELENVKKEIDRKKREIAKDEKKIVALEENCTNYEKSLIDAKSREESILAEFNEKERRLKLNRDEKKKEIEAIQGEIDELVGKRDGLGFFKGKQKREISNEIEKKELEVSERKKDIQSINNELSQNSISLQQAKNTFENEGSDCFEEQLNEEKVKLEVLKKSVQKAEGIISRLLYEVDFINDAIKENKMVFTEATLQADEAIKRIQEQKKKREDTDV